MGRHAGSRDRKKRRAPRPANPRDLTDRQVERLQWLAQLPIDEGWHPDRHGEFVYGARPLEQGGLIREEWCGYKITPAGLQALENVYYTIHGPGAKERQRR